MVFLKLEDVSQSSLIEGRNSQSSSMRDDGEKSSSFKKHR